MSAPLDVLAVMKSARLELADAPETSDHRWRVMQNLDEARAAVAKLIAERDRLANIVRDHEAQIQRMTDKTGDVAGLVEAAKRLSGCYSESCKATSLVALRAALARFGGGE